MSQTSDILFISDLHLDQDNPAITEHFLNFIQTRAQQARVLYILGDLFEVWLGDDDPSSAFDPVFQALRQLSQSTDLYFLHGNRDFLVGQQLAETLNFTIIDDPTLIQLGDKRVGLMHGDLLCTDDVDYQNFRHMVRQDDWQQQFLQKSLTERQIIAAQLREKSNQAMQEKNVSIMDVNVQTVQDSFAAMNIDILIHGHTHRPAIHQQSPKQQRFVLGDWAPEASYLSWDGKTLTLVDPRVNH